LSTSPSSQPSQNPSPELTTFSESVGINTTIKPTLITAKLVYQPELTTISPTVGIRRAICTTLITAKFVNQPELTTISESVGQFSTF
jgi:hypothetical protein